MSKLSGKPCTPPHCPPGLVHYIRFPFFFWQSVFDATRNWHGTCPLNFVASAFNIQPHSLLLAFSMK
ncbi:hypothetical protein SERLA73DRAFT_184445 [Serpula lacrymans var. lacrymans S7.3]|uniref:Uncharacterized protein n=1 Tax=Serpula lacrymans var. lacrymans (strain S7.3) TaxID=936435 RepID=F8Q393_SERL3|nr:hypothetical protein SERLA73DRAFT_184445 [Serpula lacrymans var. lacrymans S7.3]